MWCKLDKKNFGFNDDLYVGCVYVPPETSSREKRLKIDHFKLILESTQKINTSNWILVGDFNARTHNLADTLVKEKHDNDMSHEFYSKISTTRNNEDKIVNNYGKNLIEFCVATRSYIANGRT